jgi:hypothetical protein
MRNAKSAIVSERTIGRICRLSVLLWLGVVLLGLHVFATENLKSPNDVELVAPLFITNTDFRSVLIIRNAADSPTRLLIRFDALEGEEVGHRLIMVSAHSSVDIDLDDVEMVKHQFGELGSVSLSVIAGRVDSISGYIEIASRNRDERVSVEENLQVVGNRLPLPQTAFVPTPLSIPVLAIHSLGPLPQIVSINCSDAEGQVYESQLTLPARMTFLVNACISHKNEGRTYEQLLRGDSGHTKGALNIQISSGGLRGSIAVWGFATTALSGGSTMQVASIEFVPWVAPIRIL